MIHLCAKSYIYKLDQCEIVAVFQKEKGSLLHSLAIFTSSHSHWSKGQASSVGVARDRDAAAEAAEAAAATSTHDQTHWQQTDAQRDSDQTGCACCTAG